MHPRPLERLNTTLLRKYSDFDIFVESWKSHAAIVKHDHLFYEIVFIESGTVEHVTCAGVQRLHPGDIIILKPRMWHAYKNPEALNLTNCLFTHRLFTNYSSLFSIAENTRSLFGKETKSPSRTPPIVRHARPAQYAELFQDLQAISYQFEHRQHDWRASATIHLLNILVQLSRLDQPSLQEGGPALENRSKDAVIETVAYLEKHFADDITLDELAARVHISASYLSRSFKRQMGMSLFRFLNHLRIEEACRLLRYTVMPISHIASTVGYNELTYFANRFRQEVGSSPSQYRKRSLNLHG